MTDIVAPLFIKSLTIQGFRAYLKPKTFDFEKKRNLAVFAPNGSGKSSIVDALEFTFSDDGTLERIGAKALNNWAGPTALAHNLAEEKGVNPQVSIMFQHRKGDIGGHRKASGTTAARARSQEITTAKTFFAVNPIIRGSSLRRFVEEQKAEDRYAEVAGWLQLTPLVEVQRNLRLLRQQIKSAAEDITTLQDIDAQVKRETVNVVLEWDETAITAYTNTIILAPLDAKLVFTKLDKTDPGMLTLKEREKSEQQRLGLAGLRQIKDTAAALYAENVDVQTGAVTHTGAIQEFQQAIASKKNALEREAEERKKAAAAAFSAIWKAAEPLFAEGAQAIEDCPICATPFSASKAGSVAGVKQHIATHLGDLKEYASSKQALEEAAKHLTKTHQNLLAGLKALQPLLAESYPELHTAISSYIDALKTSMENASPSGQPLIVALLDTQRKLLVSIEEIEKLQGEHTYSKASLKIGQLLAIKDKHVQAERSKEELGRIATSLNAQAKFITDEIREKVQSLLDILRKPTNDIYKLIQGDKAVAIRLELPSEEDTNQQRLNLLIDFSPNRAGVQPSGYLSDSQIHSLALALRLAAIKQFNGDAPVIVLDDIVTSYDADHRRLISGMLASLFTHFQIIITTHDERFFIYLKDQLEPKDWQFLRITRFEADHGPRFADHKVTNEMIEMRWADGSHAANEIRQAEEEWLLARCREFGADIRIRDVEKAYSYERGELAEALQNSLNHLGLEPPKVQGVNNRFIQSLQKGAVENFGSHFQDSLYGDGSIGDEKTRWAEFAAFCTLFRCSKPNCNSTRFVRLGSLHRPVCAHKKCQHPFDFISVQAPLQEPHADGGV